MIYLFIFKSKASKKHEVDLSARFLRYAFELHGSNLAKTFHLNHEKSLKIISTETGQKTFAKIV